MTKRGGHKAAAVAAALLLATACASRQTAGAQAPTLAEALAHPDHHEQLRRDLRAIFSARSVDHGLWSVAVHSLKRGETLYSSNSFRLQVPASTQKLLTTAVAAERLGWDYRYTTQLYATGPVTDGRLEGDLVVVGNGDPTINPRHPDRWAAFDDWAGRLAANGVRVITGRLIGDDNAFAEPGWGLGWSWDDFAFGYGAPVSALQFNENQVELSVGPGMAAGSLAIITVSPSGSGLTLDRDVVTAAAGEPSRISLERDPGSSVLKVRGQVALGAAPLAATAAVPNPTVFYLNAVREALLRHGIVIGGDLVDIDELAMPPDMAQATLLLEDRSASLFEIVDTTNKWSRNLYAETLLRSLSPPGGPATTEAGLKVLSDTLGRWGVSTDYYLARDGSGLSRYDYLTPDALIGVLTYMWLNPELAENFRSSLPVSGVSGGLAQRLKGTGGEARVWAKTGSMSQVRSLAGYLVTEEGEPLVFAFMVNGFRVPAREIDAAMDQALLRLVAFKHPQ
ncbi:MAG: D-alanyl-D-alanine carboxypeptidase/D-alanyl-D-alanine-endopeptidase [Acidobacteriota bacterium]|nr:D-alanyl-D-alanine carboxypeptidase/D-alanyl-D-alanine-endopeptidase [Acidobacteriota bacterium]